MAGVIDLLVIALIGREEVGLATCAAFLRASALEGRALNGARGDASSYSPLEFCVHDVTRRLEPSVSLTIPAAARVVSVSRECLRLG